MDDAAEKKLGEELRAARGDGWRLEAHPLTVCVDPEDILLDALAVARREYGDTVQLMWMEKRGNHGWIYKGPVLVDAWRDKQVIYPLAKTLRDARKNRGG